MLKFTYTSLKFIGFGFSLTNFGFLVKNIDIYILYVYWILSICNMLQIYFNIMFLYLHEIWRKRISISKIQNLENTVFVFKANFHVTKMVQIVCNMC